jgi:transposase-like protein
MERYTCKECGKEASVDSDGKITRTCEHTGLVILDMALTVTGDGGMDA